MVEKTASDAQQTPARLDINAQYIKDFSFENPNAPQIFGQQNGQPNINIKVDVAARKLDGDQYECVLSLNAKAEAGTTTAFVIELAYAGVFTIQNVSQEQLSPLLLIECPRHLFPFARAIIADATINGGFPPLLIQPIDFVDLFRQQVAARQQAEGDKEKKASANGKAKQASGAA